MKLVTQGQLVRLTATFRTLAGALVDPDTVSVTVSRDADGGSVTDVYGVGDLLRTSTGIYYIDVDTSPVGGIWHWRFHATGTGQNAQQGDFYVVPSVTDDSSSDEEPAGLTTLREDLADDTGASLVGFIQSGTGAVERTALAKMREQVSVFDFMSAAEIADVQARTALLDVTTALNTAFAVAGAKVRMPSGTYLVTANLAAPACAEIIGDGEDATIIKPSVAVTELLAIGGATYPRILSRFKIDGTNTTGAGGIYLGKAASIGINISYVRITSFTGPGAYGMRVGDVLKSTFRNITIEGCYVDLLLQKTTASYPTTCNFIGGSIRTAVTKGLKIVDGFTITFNGTVFESNTEEGVYVAPGSGTAIDLRFKNCWFELNYGFDTTNYQFVTTCSGGSARPILRDCYFNGNGSTAKSINLDGAAVAGFVLDNVQVPNVAAGVIVQNSAYGTVANFPANLTYLTIVSDALGLAYNVISKVKTLEIAWTAWVPTYSSDVGDVSATFSGGTVTTTTGRYLLFGKMLFIELKFQGTLNAVTPNYLQWSLPTGTLKSTVTRPTQSINNGVGTDGVGDCVAGAAVVKMYLANTGSNYTSAGLAGGSFSGIVEVQ